MDWLWSCDIIKGNYWDGAIIGTRAVVTKDVPPYTLLEEASPARIIKTISDDIIDKLLKMKWWNWPEEKIAESLSISRAGNLSKLEKYNNTRIKHLNYIEKNGY